VLNLSVYRIHASLRAGVVLILFAVLFFPQSAAAQNGSAAPQAPSTPPDPVLLKRPSPAPAAAASAVTGEGRIHLDVVVADAAGKTVPGLGPWDFKVLDGSQPRKILTFRSFDGVRVLPDPPVEVILLLDTVNLPFSQVAFVREQVKRFLLENGGHLSQPVSLFLLSDAGLRVQPKPSTDGNALVSVLDQLKGSVRTVGGAAGGEGSLERFQISIRKLEDIAENEATRPGRKLLLWIGPGWPMLNSSQFQFSSKDQRNYFDAIVELSTRLREARITLYSVEPADSTSSGLNTFTYQSFLKGVRSPREADTGNLALKVLAVESGGRILGPDNNLVAQIESCVADAGAFYSLSFDPPRAAHTDEYHDLKVEVSQPGLTARTTSGYYDQP
jgi:VWFA-related protein